ncbi:MAG: hypothetical protein QOE82_2820 [Thermoanaerobaculia bacterium]|jgi:uncharacterized membrane protein YagU involved in acid resistance|nr:hypothetical protein [Thermoanaerobaculia bacterium]
MRKLIAGGIVVGSLDITYAILFWWFRGVAPTRVFQSVAAGVLGRDSFNLGMKSALLGAALHYFIAFSIVIVYYLASKWLPVLIDHAVICGIVYGIGVYIVMNYVVIPLSNAARPKTFNLLWVSCSVIVHMFLIGLPAALFVRTARREDGL